MADQCFLLGAGGGGPDAWAVRESMMKPWQSAVTHRLVLQRQQGSAPAAAASAARREGASVGHSAKWVKPSLPGEDRFLVDGSGVCVL